MTEMPVMTAMIDDIPAMIPTIVRNERILCELIAAIAIFRASRKNILNPSGGLQHHYFEKLAACLNAGDSGGSGPFGASYSYISASMGLRREAFIAGIRPEIIPTRNETAIAARMTGRFTAAGMTNLSISAATP